MRGWRQESGSNLGEKVKAEHATGEELLAQLREYAAETGTTLGIDRVDGHWRAGFIANDELGEVGFALHALGRDETTAIRRLAELMAARRLETSAAQRGAISGLAKSRRAGHL